MPGRLEYERAIRRSDLPPPSRHLALTIATWADMNTGIIPDRFQPSMRTLLAATGMSKGSMLDHLARLEAEGWLTCQRPSKRDAAALHLRNAYGLTVPDGLEAGSGADLGQELTQPRSGADPDQGQEPTQGKVRSRPSPRSGADPKSPSQSRKSPKSQEVPAGSAEPKPPAAAKPNRHQVADDLTAAFWERHKTRCTQSFIAVRGVIRTAIGNGIDRDDLARALDQVAREGRPVSGGTLQIALQPASQATAPRATGHQPFKCPPSSAYLNGQSF